jgi:exodeoxyribonuclease V beta subunit
MLVNPKLAIVPEFSPADVEACEDACRATFTRLQEVWSNSRAEITEIICTHKGLSRSAENYREDLLPSLCEGMAAYLAADNPFGLFDGYEKFCAGSIEQQKLKKTSPPEHVFFVLCEELLEHLAKRFLALRGELVRFCRERLPVRKRELNIRFFDDLLNDLYLALCGESGATFAASLRGKYRAALIDEFQDTDPVQYDIFRRIYETKDYPLFLIGDPKQAIYSFRGADIFAYMEAAADVAPEKRFTLTGNWRSTPRLLAAFNTVFSNEAKPFVYDAITYYPVRSGKGDTGKQLTVAGGSAAPLQVWYLPPGEDGMAVSVGTANAIIPTAVAAEIARLLQDGVLAGRPVVPADMAVIVRSHRQGGYIQAALRALGIPSVMRSDMSIFATGEAREVATLLRALSDPGSEVKVRAVLVTDMLGRSGDDIARLLDDEEAWEECLERFRDYHQTWLDCGFMVMAQALMAAEGVRGRLLRRPDGERRLTNLLHCFEVIHQQGHERGLGSEGLAAWFGERVVAGDAAEEYQIRLETDEKAVKIVTVHVSKGLEYPIVFCPFMWGGVRDNDEVVTFHDGFTMVKDFGSPDHDRHRVLAEKETLAESLRLLYVALTRAQYRCYLSAGKIADRTGKNRPETSPLAYLFHSGAETRTADELVSRLADEVAGLPAQKIVEQLWELQEKGAGTIAVCPAPVADAVSCFVPHPDDGRPLASRKFSGHIRQDWRVASFTSFAAHEAPANELPDRDETRGSFGPEGGERPAGMSIFTFPRGAQAGIFLHEIFEGLDFARYTAEAVVAPVVKGLARYGYDPAWQPHVCAMVDSVVTSPLSAPEGVFTLAGLKDESWIPELEFFFPLRFVTSDLMGGYLRKWGARYQAADLDRLCAAFRFKPVQGMVRGFMDLVFEQGGRYYLVDWKSNHLGYRVGDYGREALKTAMERHLYPLQYLLYTVALNRYLALRVRGYDYGTHFGGVIYVFLRGVSPGHGEQFGFFRDLPPVGLIDELTQGLIKAGG